MDYIALFDMAQKELSRIDHELEKLDKLGYNHPEELEDAANALVAICGYAAMRIDPEVLVIKYVHLKNKTRASVRQSMREAIEFAAIFRDPEEVAEWKALMGDA